MKHTKLQRYLSLTLSGVLVCGIVASFAACGKNDEEDITTTGNNYAVEQTDEFNDETVPPVTDEVSSTEEPATVPSTGVSATDVKSTAPTKNPTTPNKPVTTTKKQPTKPANTDPILDDENWIAENMPDRFQRRFGFSDAYDAMAAAGGMYIVNKTMIFNYRSFDPVDKLSDGSFKDKAWRVEFWKGAYGFGTTVGCEIGVYTGNPNTPHTFGKIYPCASDQNLLKMSQTLYYNGEKMFTTKYRAEWWDTGFVPAQIDDTSSANLNKVLHVNGRISFRDTAMRNAFLKEFEKKGFVKNSDLTVSGHYSLDSDNITVRFMW